MSENAENHDPREGLLETPFEDSIIEHLWYTFKAFQHEVVRANEVCDKCSDNRFQEQMLLGSQAQVDPILIYNFAGVLHRSRHCWICRFLCRIAARATPQERFAHCIRENLPVKVTSCHGRWEEDLLLSLDSAGPSGSWRMSFELPRNDPGCWAYEELRFHSAITCHRLISPPSRRFQKLLSDPVMQRTGLFSGVQRYLSICESQHTRCSRNADPSVSNHDNFRLIDVNKRILCQPAIGCSYIALSYVWGEEPFARACTASDGAPLLSDLIKQINRDGQLHQTLPQSIEDAFIVTQNLGQQYLWLDLLCIDQFDTSIKQNAIANMGKIYSSAFLTICVVDGSSMFSGIPGISGPLYSRYQIITDTENARYMFNRFDRTNWVLEDSDWAKRAWTFQEGELSARRLCFSENGVFVICKEEIFHDILELDESDNRIKGSLNTGNLHYLALGFDLDMQSWNFDAYARMAASYSHRSMTFPSDAFNAITGAIQRIAEKSSMNFVAALPVGDICNALLWLNHSKSYGRRAEGPRRSGFPSWSWLGWEGPREYWFWLQDPRHLNDKQECMYSLVDRDDDVLYRDAVKIKSSACATFESIAPDTSNAILILTTTIARFPIKKIAPPEARTQGTDHRWLLLDQSGQKIGRGTSYNPYGYFYDHTGEALYTFCSLYLHPSSSAEMIEMRVEEIDFVLLQHWVLNTSESVPEKLGSAFSMDEAPETKREFEDTVWIMAIKRRPDGVAERLNVMSIPAKAWFSADPQSTVVRLA